jgi:hypothetical protein
MDDGVMDEGREKKIGEEVIVRRPNEVVVPRPSVINERRIAENGEAGSG